MSQEEICQALKAIAYRIGAAACILSFPLRNIGDVMSLLVSFLEEEGICLPPSGTCDIFAPPRIEKETEGRKGILLCVYRVV